MLRATVALVAVLASCVVAGRVAASPAPLHYVALGDSATASNWVGMVAQKAAARHHTKAALRRLVEENTVAALDAKVASSANTIRRADLITVMIGVDQVVHVAFANGCAASACARAEQAYEHQYASLLDHLTTLRSADVAKYRLLTEYDLPGVFHGATASAVTAALRRERRFVCAQAHARGMRCVDIYAAFNGVDGRRNPRSSGLVRADNHPTARGDALIASLVEASGL